MFEFLTKFSGKQDPTFKFSNLNNNEILNCAVIILRAYSLVCDYYISYIKLRDQISKFTLHYA